ncbi:hypothetical protein BDR04DRAFT_1168692, partial [Suillus decipiens]
LVLDICSFTSSLHTLLLRFFCFSLVLCLCLIIIQHGHHSWNRFVACTWPSGQLLCLICIKFHLWDWQDRWRNYGNTLGIFE